MMRLPAALRDEKEGADILMVKPAALYTDVIAELKQQTLKPVAAYHVSGEYAAVETLAEKGLLNREAAILKYGRRCREAVLILLFLMHREMQNWIDKMEY